MVEQSAGGCAQLELALSTLNQVSKLIFVIFAKVDVHLTAIEFRIWRLALPVDTAVFRGGPSCMWHECKIICVVHSLCGVGSVVRTLPP